MYSCCLCPADNLNPNVYLQRVEVFEANNKIKRGETERLENRNKKAYRYQINQKIDPARTRTWSLCQLGVPESNALAIRPLDLSKPRTRYARGAEFLALR